MCCPHVSLSAILMAVFIVLTQPPNSLSNTHHWWFFFLVVVWQTYEGHNQEIGSADCHNQGYQSSISTSVYLILTLAQWILTSFSASPKKVLKR